MEINWKCQCHHHHHLAVAMHSIFYKHTNIHMTVCNTAKPYPCSASAVISMPFNSITGMSMSNALSTNNKYN